jgi:hypothetical protein
MSLIMTLRLELVLKYRRLGLVSEKQPLTQLLRRRPRKPRGSLQAGSRLTKPHPGLLLL